MWLPDHNCPPEPDIDISNNFRAFVSDEKVAELELSSRLESKHLTIKESSLKGYLDCPLGDGVFLTDDAPALKRGDKLPMFIWGRLTPADEIKNLPPAEILSPGLFEMSTPYTWMNVIVDKRCPAGKVNDARHTTKKINLSWQQSARVRELITAGVPHVMIQAYAEDDINVRLPATLPRNHPPPLPPPPPTTQNK